MFRHSHFTAVALALEMRCCLLLSVSQQHSQVDLKQVDPSCTWMTTLACSCCVYILLGCWKISWILAVLERLHCDCFSKCTNTVGWLMGRAFRLWKILIPFSPKVFLLGGPFGPWSNLRQLRETGQVNYTALIRVHTSAMAHWNWHSVVTSKQRVCRPKFSRTVL